MVTRPLSRMTRSMSQLSKVSDLYCDNNSLNSEINGYAEFLGMDLKEDADLLYIAEEGLKAPVPEPWKAYSNENEEIYYCNTVTGQLIYDHPLDEVYRKKFQEAKQKKLGGRAGQGIGVLAPVFGSKQDDPLIRAETEKKVNE